VKAGQPGDNGTANAGLKSLTNQLTKNFDFSGHSLAMTGNTDGSKQDTDKTEKNR
jgi:hypothetical protein